jgi:hypothetical protein
MGCSKLQKNVCTSANNCHWVVGKGCRVVSTTNAASPKTKSPRKQIVKAQSPKPMPPAKLQSPSRDNIVPVLVSDKVKNQVAKYPHPKMNLSSTFHNAIDKILLMCTRYILHGPKETLDVSDIRTVFQHKHVESISDLYTMNGNDAIYSLDQLKQSKVLFFTATFQKNVETIFGKKLTQYAAVFLAAGLEYLFTEIVEMSGNVAKREGVKSITREHLVKAIQADNELQTFFRLINPRS